MASTDTKMARIDANDISGDGGHLYSVSESSSTAINSIGTHLEGDDYLETVRWRLKARENSENSSGDYVERECMAINGRNNTRRQSIRSCISGALGAVFAFFPDTSNWPGEFSKYENTMRSNAQINLHRLVDGLETLSNCIMTQAPSSRKPQPSNPQDGEGKRKPATSQEEEPSKRQRHKSSKSGGKPIQQGDDEDDDLSSGRDGPSDDGFDILATSQAQRLWACPFYKDDPVTWHRCWKKYDLKRVDDVKQHLKRSHTYEGFYSSNYVCPTCWIFWPKSSSDRAHGDWSNHIRSRKCSPRNIPPRFIDNDQLAVLHDKRRRGAKDTEKWFEIWDIVFPGKPRPKSPYVNAGSGEIAERIYNPGVKAIENILSREGVTNSSSLASQIMNAIRGQIVTPSTYSTYGHDNDQSGSSQLTGFSEKRPEESRTTEFDPSIIDPSLLDLPAIPGTIFQDAEGTGDTDSTLLNAIDLNYYLESDDESKVNDHTLQMDELLLGLSPQW